MRNQKAIIAGAIAFWGLFCDSEIAVSYPENVRHGYPSCVACHVSPAGGGVLTPYGRGSSEAFISMFSKEGEGNPGYGLTPPPPDWFSLGGDQRGVEVITGNPNLNRNSGQTALYIPMQDDTELAVKPLTGITLDASIGVYGPDHKVEYRKSYLKADLFQNLSVRVGRFLPAFGVNLPDHTTYTRQALGFGEGAESYNIETALMTPYGESILTFIDGTSTDFSAGTSGNYGFTTDTMTGVAWRNAVYLGSSCQLGVSYLGVSSFDSYRQAYGAFLQAGITTKAYVLAEYDRKFENATTSNVALLKLGYELTQGLMATLQTDVQDSIRDGRIGLQWWPRPHFELLGELRREFQSSTNGAYTDSAVMMFHHYL